MEQTELVDRRAGNGPAADKTNTESARENTKQGYSARSGENPITSDFGLTIWMAIFPITYLLHIAEEYWGGEGYPAYLLRLRGVHLDPKRFLIDQSIGLLLVLIGVILARQLIFARFLLTTLGALVLTNGITHTVTAIADGGYGPGLLSSALLWIPLGIFTLIRISKEIPMRRFFIAAGVGVTINAIIAIVALRGGKFV